MQTHAGESLLDGAGFLAELKTLEDGLSAPLVEQRANVPFFDDLPAPGQAAAAGRAVFAEDEPESAPSLLTQVMAAVMFVLMMGVGAAGAVLVYHDRVARLLTNLTIRFP